MWSRNGEAKDVQNVWAFSHPELFFFFISPLTESVFRLPISMWRTAAHPVWSPMKVFPLYLFQVRRV